MKNFCTSAALLAALFVGCTHVTMINHEAPDAPYDKINQKAKNRTSQIQLKSREQYLGKNVMVTPDSTLWFEPATGEKHSISTNETSEIRVIDHGRGALDGFLTGASIGIIFGGVVFAVMNKGLCDAADCNTTEAAIIRGGILGGAGVGLVLGLPLGAAKGSKHKFIFDGGNASLKNNRNDNR